MWTDLLSRWTAPRPLRRLVPISVMASSSSDNFDWPSAKKIMKFQHLLASLQPSNHRLNKDSIYCDATADIRDPDDDSGLQPLLFIIAHTGPCGHRAASSATSALQKHFA